MSPMRGAIALLLVLAAAMPVRGHHSIAPFDQVHGTIIAGKVTGFAWENPHTHIYLDVIGEDDVIEHWLVELESPNLLRQYGWARDTVKPGDRIAVTGGRAKNGSLIIRGLYVELTDGRKLPGAPGS